MLRIERDKLWLGFVLFCFVFFFFLFFIIFFFF